MREVLETEFEMSYSCLLVLLVAGTLGRLRYNTQLNSHAWAILHTHQSHELNLNQLIVLNGRNTPANSLQLALQSTYGVLSAALGLHMPSPEAAGSSFGQPKFQLVCEVHDGDDESGRQGREAPASLY